MAVKTKGSPMRNGQHTEGEGDKKEVVVISPPKFRTVTFKVTGTSPYMQCRFSGKALAMMREKQEQGQSGKKGKAKPPRNFNEDFEQAKHVSKEGWYGVPASAFRAACIDVCRMVDFQMTRAKMSIFIEADGYDRVDQTPLVRLGPGDPEKTEMPVRNASGVADIRVRPMWKEWSLELRVRYDEDQFKLADVTNLLARAGLQVGIGEGRPFSKESNGMGFGLFSISEKDK